MSTVASTINTILSFTSGSQAVTTSGNYGFDTTYGIWMYIPSNGYYQRAHWLQIPWNTIKSQFGTANANQILSGYTATTQNGIRISGTNQGYDAGYNNGYNSGNSNGVPNQCGVQYWSRDNESTQTWNCTSAGWYVIFVYGMVNANGRYETPNVSVNNGTWKNGHDVNTSTNNRVHAWLYYIENGGSVSCSWSVHRGTYYWRNGFLVIRVR